LSERCLPLVFRLGGNDPIAEAQCNKKQRKKKERKWEGKKRATKA